MLKCPTAQCLGEGTLRRLLIIKQHVLAAAQSGKWLSGMLSRKPPMLVRVALANKMAWIVWALMARAASTSLRWQRHKPTVGREDVGAKEEKATFGATVVRLGSGEPVCNRVPPSTRH